VNGRIPRLEDRHIGNKEEASGWLMDKLSRTRGGITIRYLNIHDVVQPMLLPVEFLGSEAGADLEVTAQY
jgi:hypothetical protein